MSTDRELKAMETSLSVMKPLDEGERHRVLSWLAAKLGVCASAPLETPNGGAGNMGGGGIQGSIKQFLKQKLPRDDVARVTALGYFLTHGSNQARWKQADLVKARIEASVTDFNISRAISNAKRAKYLTSAGEHGLYQVTTSGEALVEAMPDGNAMTQINAQDRTRRRRRPSGKRSKNSAAKI